MFKKGRRTTERLLEHGTRVPAEILEATYGRFVTNTNSGVGGSIEKTSASQTLRLRVEPPGGAPYEVTLDLDKGDQQAPPTPGVRLEVLVDPDDPQTVALVPEAVFTMPGAGTWQPEGGTAGELSKLAEQGDATALMGRLEELRKTASPPDRT